LVQRLALGFEVRLRVHVRRVKMRVTHPTADDGNVHALEGCDLARLLQDAIALIPQILEVEYCSVLELLPDGKELLLRAGAGWKEGSVGHAKLLAGRESPAGFTLLSSSPVILEDLGTETRFRGPQLLLNHGVVSGVTVVM
jgi:GAF domain-containing protein